jgi:hypothetical protein
MEELSQEFNDYLLLQENDLQSSITDDLKRNDGRYLGDSLWNHIHNIKRPDGQFRFSRLHV